MSNNYKCKAEIKMAKYILNLLFNEVYDVNAYPI